jgi:hypothetical protein
VNTAQSLDWVRQVGFRFLMYLYVVVARVHAVLSLSLPSHDLLISLGREHFRLLVNQVAFRAVFQML